MSRYSPAQTCESDLVGLLLLASPAPPDDGDHDIGTPSAATLVDGSRAPAAVEEEEEEEELAVDPLLHSPLMEDASLVVAMFEPSEAELCSNDVVGATAVSSAAGARLAGASASVVVEEEEERRRLRLPAIKEGEVSECRSTDSEDADIKFSEARRDEEKQSTARRTRSAEVHNRCERRRRGRINQRFKALQELVPRCNDKSDKASILDETIVYMKSLQQQVQMMSGGCDITGMMFPVFQTLMLPGAAIAMNNIGQPPLPGTACSGDVTAGGGGCPSYPALPFGHISRVPAVSADCTGQQAAAPWPPCPPAFQSMAMASFGQAMGAAIGRQYYTAPNATNMTYQDLLQVGSSPVDGYQFLGIH